MTPKMPAVITTPEVKGRKGCGTQSQVQLDSKMGDRDIY